jgi:hypothetical protein
MEYQKHQWTINVLKGPVGSNLLPSTGSAFQGLKRNAVTSFEVLEKKI